MRSSERRPDNGVPSVCASAADQVRGISTDLASAADRTGNLASPVRNAWQGQAASAFCSSLDAAVQSSRLTVAAWDRVVSALARYASRLEDIQVRGDQIRSALTSAEDSLDAAKKTLTRYQKDDDTAAWRITHARGTVESLTTDVTNQVVALDNLRAERQALDNETATALHGAPGAGAAAWQAIAYRNGRAVPSADLLDELLDLLDRDPAGNLDLLHQFLLMHSNDAELMGRFFDGLGPRGLLSLMRHTGPGGTATHVFDMLTTGFATASRTWDVQQQERFGAGLIGAIDNSVERGAPWDTDLVAFLLCTPGIAPHVGLGAFQRLETMRVRDPDRFARIMLEHTTADFAISDRAAGTLENSIFLLLSQIPGAARSAIMSGPDPNGTITYWYGQHSWAADGFEGPAALLHAIVTDPTVRVHSASDPAWAELMWFTSLALVGLAENPRFTIADVSPAANLHLATSLAHLIPEIAGIVTGSNNTIDNLVWTTTFLDGESASIPGLGLDIGQLGLVLGIVLQEPAALNRFAAGLEQHRHATGGIVTPLTVPATTDLAAEWVGGLYGITYGALAGQYAVAAQQRRDDLDATVASLNRLISLIPIASTGKASADYAIQVAASEAPDLLSTLSSTPTRNEIERLSVELREQGRELLSSSWDVAAQTDRLHPDTAANLRARVLQHFDTHANAASNAAPIGAYLLDRGDE